MLPFNPPRFFFYKLIQTFLPETQLTPLIFVLRTVQNITLFKINSGHMHSQDWHFLKRIISPF